LKDALGDGGSFVGGIGALLLGELAGCGERSMVNCLENLLVQLASLGRLEGHAQGKESIRKTLHTQTNGPVAHVAVVRLLDGVVVDINDLVEVADDDPSDL